MMVLRRTPFRRPVYTPPPRSPLGGIVRKVHSGPTEMREPIEKIRAVRSDSYKRFVASQACFGCGVVGYSQAAHPNAGKGLALKTCDLLCFPLCGPRFGLLGCHAQHDLSIEMSRDERRNAEAGYVARMQAIAKAAGREEFA